MKSIFIATIVLSIIAVALSDDSVKEKWAQTLKECQAEEGGSDVDIEPFIKHEMMKTQKSKCILACINDKIGFTTNGQLNVDKATELTKKVYGSNTEKATQWMEATKKCSDLTATDRCDRAEELLMCTILKLTGEGLNPKDFVL